MSGKYLEKFEQLFNFTRKIVKECGIDVIPEDYKRNWKTLNTFLVINFAILFTFYTMYVDVAYNDNWGTILISLAMLGNGVQGYAKFVCIMVKSNQHRIRFVHKEISDIYIEFEHKSLEYRNNLNSSISRAKRIFTTLFSAVVVAIILVLGVPLYMLIVHNKRTLILNFTFPYIDIKTDFGYYLTLLIHAFCTVLGGLGNFVLDAWCFIYVAHVPLISNILKCKFKDLDVMLEVETKDNGKTKHLLLDILKWHQKYLIFIENLRISYYWVIIVEVVTLFVSIISTIICIFFNLWPAAPAYLLVSVMLLWSYCALGNIVEVANEDVITFIYDCCWYKLSVSEQKLLLIMLANCQQSRGMTIGAFAPLTLNTALQITKTIYTISMMLQEFLNN